MEKEVIINNIFSKLRRIRHKSDRFIGLCFQFVDAQEISEFETIDSDLTEIIDEIEKKEVEEFGA